jgi:hypothetical protein
MSLGESTVLNKLSIFNFPNICDVEALGVTGNIIPNIIIATKIPEKTTRFIMKVLILTATKIENK